MPTYYDPSVFDVTTLDAAKQIILTKEDADSSDQRWAKETPYLAELMVEHLKLVPSDLVLDYGCGVGRMSAALIKKCGCSVIGVDQSPSMRALAQVYVSNPKFATFAPGALLADVVAPCHHAISVWVLQHI